MPQPPTSVAETHVSIVIFVGDRAYKLKKPVRFEFVDLTSREARERLCHREVELNRRLAPDVYLGVLDIVDTDGRPVDHLVEMGRMPNERRLSTLVEEGADVNGCLRQLAHQLAAFHEGAATSPGISAAATPDAIRRLWDDSLGEMAPFVGEVLDARRLQRIHELAHRYLDGRTPLFELRVADGRIRDGHGDLLADDIFCLDDGPRVLDCIEFDDRLRYGDVVADIAFLAMDLERSGRPELARRFLGWYREFSGESHPESLADHYVAYRALIRSKIACLRTEQGDAEAARWATRLAEMAADHLERGRVRLILVGGLPGTGKSTVAAGLSEPTGWATLRSDEVRKELARVPPDAPATGDFEHGIYTPELTKATYGQLIGRARRLLELGESVVLDASWVRADDRQAAARVAAETSADLVQLRCVLGADEAAARLERRREEGGDASDADARVARAMAEQFEAWPEATELSTEASPEEVLERALSLTGPFPSS